MVMDNNVVFAKSIQEPTLEDLDVAFIAEGINCIGQQKVNF
jgi:hypothetical protein